MLLHRLYCALGCNCHTAKAISMNILKPVDKAGFFLANSSAEKAPEYYKFVLDILRTA